MTPATQEEIMLFKQGAAARYAELGIDLNTAEAIFNTHMDKVAAEIGVKPLSPGATKVAHAILSALRR